MSKAIFGHIGGGAESLLAAEVVRLRRRVRELESLVEHSEAGQLTSKGVSIVDSDPVDVRLLGASAPAVA
ncbi:MAG: hypothetical protein WCI29_11365 [Actinomycetes bacterium]